MEGSLAITVILMVIFLNSTIPLPWLYPLGEQCHTHMSTENFVYTDVCASYSIFASKKKILVTSQMS